MISEIRPRPWTDTLVAFFCKSHRIGHALLKEMQEEISLIVDAKDVITLVVQPKPLRGRRKNGTKLEEAEEREMFRLGAEGAGGMTHSKAPRAHTGNPLEDFSSGVP